MSKSNNVTKDRFYIAYGSNLNLGRWQNAARQQRL